MRALVRSLQAEPHQRHNIDMRNSVDDGDLAHELLVITFAVLQKLQHYLRAIAEVASVNITATAMA
jgi:hypothetical protein